MSTTTVPNDVELGRHLHPRPAPSIGRPRGLAASRGDGHGRIETTAATFSPPTVVWRGSTDPQAPLVVLLVDPGTETAEVVGIADFLPAAAAYAIARPSTTLLSTTMAWFRRWLDEVVPASRPVVLVGFSGGAPFAGGLLLDDPSRYAGAAILHGTLPFDAGVPTDDGRLEGIPVLVAQAEDDHVIPRELLDRTWEYLHDRSRAEVTGRREPGRHEFTYGSLAGLQIWLAQFLTDHGGDT